jgi:nitrite reductase (NO-forming)
MPRTLVPGLATAGLVACATAAGERLGALPVEFATLTPTPGVPTPITRRTSALVKVSLEVREYEAELAPGVRYKFWSSDGTAPGPMIRVREGDLVELTLKNAPPACSRTRSTCTP